MGCLDDDDDFEKSFFFFYVFQICEYDRFSRPCVVGDLHFSLADRENVFGSSNAGPGVDIWADVMRNTVKKPDGDKKRGINSLKKIFDFFFVVAGRKSTTVASVAQLPAVG